jgi:hypothetical protein
MTTILIGSRTPRVFHRRSKTARTRHLHQSAPGALHIVVAGLVLAAGAAALIWNLSGGHLLFMQTPSMCPTVCVGSLIADRPLSGALHVGEVITFHPPGSNVETYTHEIYRIFTNGMIQTRGIGNPDHDPWLLTRSEIVGKSNFSIWGVGWILKALPFMAAGVFCWAFGRVRIRGRNKFVWDTLWVTALISMPLLLLRPLVRGVITSTTVNHADSARLRATLVNTGLLPVRFSGVAHSVSHVKSTETVRLDTAAVHGHAVLREAASLYWWGWSLVALVVISPFLRYLWHACRAYEPRG